MKGLFCFVVCVWGSSHLAEGLISWPFFSHLASAFGSVNSTDRTIFFPLRTVYADSNRFRNSAETSTQSQTEEQTLCAIFDFTSLVFSYHRWPWAPRPSSSSVFSAFHAGQWCRIWRRSSRTRWGERSSEAPKHPPPAPARASFF